jgi:hypothetical protein
VVAILERQHREFGDVRINWLEGSVEVKALYRDFAQGWVAKERCRSQVHVASRTLAHDVEFGETLQLVVRIEPANLK